MVGLPGLDLAEPEQHGPRAPADATGQAFRFSQLLMPDLVRGLNERRRARGSNGQFVPQPPHRRPEPPQSKAKEMDAVLRESLGFSEPILSGKAVKTVKSEYLSRAFALDLKSIPRDTSAATRRAETERAYSERPREQRAEPPVWQAGPTFEGLLSVIPRGSQPLTTRGRLEDDHGRKQHPTSRGDSKGSGRTILESIATPRLSRGVVVEREQALEMPSYEKIAALRQEMGLHTTFSEQANAPGTHLATQVRIDTQHSVALYDTSVFDRSIDKDNDSVPSAYSPTAGRMATIMLRRDSLLVPLSSAVPKGFKGGRSFPLGRGGTDHRQMLGIPSTANNPAVVAAREALRRRFRTTVEAFAFLCSIAEEDTSFSSLRSGMQPLSREVIEKGFKLLRIRVDVSQLMLQIADKDHRLSTGASVLSLTNPLRCSGATQRGTSVSFESWNQQLAWHPPLLQPSRALEESLEGIMDICATALRATAALNAVKATTWRAPTSNREIQETLSFLHESRELFEVFAAAPESLRTKNTRTRSPPLRELRLSFRDVEALFRQVHVLPGWITSQGLSMIYGELESEDHSRLMAKGGRGNMHGGITFGQYQRCVQLVAKRLRLTLVIDGKEIASDYLVAFDEQYRGFVDSNQTGKKKRLTIEVSVVRAFAKILRVTSDNRTFRRFSSEFKPSDVAQDMSSNVTYRINGEYHPTWRTTYGTYEYHIPLNGDTHVGEAEKRKLKQGVAHHKNGKSSGNRDWSPELAGEQVDAAQACEVAETARVHSVEDLMTFPGFVELMRTIGLVATSKQGESNPSDLKLVRYRRAKEIFETVAGARGCVDGYDRGARGASLSFDAYLDVMYLVAAELDESAAPYLSDSPRDPTGYPPYTGSTLLGNMLCMYRDNQSLVSELTLKEALALIEMLAYTKLQAGQSFCLDRAIASRAAIVLSGSMKEVDADSHADSTKFLARGSWCAPDVPLLGRHVYTSSITAESEVELAVISIEAFGAFCDRIRSLYVKGQTHADAEEVKERLFSRHNMLSTARCEKQKNMLTTTWPLESRSASPFQNVADQVQKTRREIETLREERNRLEEGDDCLYRESLALFKEERRDAGEQLQGIERPKTALVQSDYAEQLHELGCYYFNLKHISAARRLLCEACRIRMEIFGAHDGRTLSSVRVLEQVDKWAYRQVDDSIRVKVLDRCVKSIVPTAHAKPQSQHQIEADMREFLRSRGGHGLGHGDVEVRKLGLKFLLVHKEEEVPMPRELVQKYSNLQFNRKEWLKSMQSNVELLLDERARWEELRRAPRPTGEHALSCALKNVSVLSATQWQFRSLYEGMRKALTQQEARGLHMGVETIIARMANYAVHVVSTQHDRPAPCANSWNSWGGMAEVRMQQAERIFDLKLVNKKMTAMAIVDLQAEYLRKMFGISWKDAYQATASVQEAACVMLQSNLRCHFARNKRFIFKCANRIKLNYRVHRARRLLKQQRISCFDTWQARRHAVVGRGSVEEWRDRHKAVQRTMTKAMEIYDRFRSGGSDLNDSDNDQASSESMLAAPVMEETGVGAGGAVIEGAESERQEVQREGNRESTGHEDHGDAGAASSLPESERASNEVSIMYQERESEDPSEYAEDTEEEDAVDYLLTQESSQGEQYYSEDV